MRMTAMKTRWPASYPWRIGFVMPWLLMASSPAAHAQRMEACGDFSGPNPHYNYTDPRDADMINMMNGAHFNADVESLIRGQTGTIQKDLDFILRNSPNHHRALYASAMLHLRAETERFRDEEYSIRCWFDRAMRFASSDGVVRMIYGIYLHRRQEFAEAEQRYKEALALAPGLVEAHYNLGLLYVDIRRYDEAVIHARASYAAGYQLPGLMQKLRSAGYRID